ncbi:MAG: TlpA family protein disulfide reductase [Fibromonadaceae bacterium]|nr:TlpA family protein disulfide reductase [Fibromonadaceae bacterium]
MPILLAFFLLFISCGEVFTEENDNSSNSHVDSSDSRIDNIDSNDIIMDFNIPLISINSDKQFSAFSKRLLMIYYMDPFCPHCQRGYGTVQQIADEYGPKGLSSIAIAVRSKSDILKFIEEHEASIPFFQDSEYAFMEKYKIEYVPMRYLVFPNGKTLSYENSERQIKKMVSNIEAFLSK